MSPIQLSVDVNNLYYCISKRYPGRKINYNKYYVNVMGDNIPYKVLAYGRQVNNEAVGFITCLRHFGYEVKYKRGSKKVGYNVDIAVDILNNVDKIDEVILGSSDPEFVALVEMLKSWNIKVTVVACGISKDLKRVADKWVEIDETFLEEASSA